MVPNDTTSDPGAVSAPSPADDLLRLWQAGSAPDLAAFLAAVGDLSAADLVSVLLVDQRQRWQLGQPVPAEAYLDRYPAVRGDEDGTVDLVYGEFLCRERHGPAPTADEFAWRFPAVAPVLRAQIDLHRALQAPRAAAAETLPFEHPPTARGPGPCVPGYEVIGEVGRGGMGVVYRARDVRLKRPVALKFLLAGAHARPADLARFRTEAESAARLRHPNIVQVFEVGESDGSPFLVLEFVEGGSLKDALADRPRPARWAAEVIRTLAGAVQYAHAQGILHRDLKPANILLGSAEGGGRRAEFDPNSTLRAPHSALSPKVTDFGLAKQLDDGSPSGNPTRTGDIFGTPSYMSPEQAAGRAAEVGPTTDVYALGAVLYECLTGRPPFQGSDPVRTLQQVEAADPVSPSRLQPGLPRDLVTICLKCLEKEPRKRYPTAAALEEDLGRFLAGAPIRARPVGLPERAWRWGRRNPLPATLASLVSLLVVVIAAGSVVYALGLRAATNEARTSAREREREAKLAEARAIRFGNGVGRRFAAAELLAEAARIRPGPDLRDEAIAAMALDDFRPIKSWPAPAGVGWRLAFSGDFGRYASVDAVSGTITVRRVEDDRELYRVERPSYPGHVRLNEDGTAMWVDIGPGRIQVWRLTGDEPVLAFMCDGVGIGTDNLPAISFSPDGRRCAAAHARGIARVHDIGTGRVVGECRTGRNPRHVAFHPTRPLLSVAGPAGTQVRDTETGKLLVELAADAGSTCSAWHPGGRHLAVIGDGRTTVWDVIDRRQTGTLATPLGGGDWIYFNRNGDLLFGISWSRGLRFWEPWSGAELLKADFPFLIWSGAHPDGRIIVVALVDQQVRMLELVRSPARRVLVAEPRSKESLHYQPAVATAGRGRGRLAAVGRNDGVALFDLATGAEAAHLAIGHTRAVTFDGTGALWTNGAAGVRRWPVADDPDGTGVSFGPSDQLLNWHSDCQIACSADGSVAAVAAHSGAVVVRRDRPGKFEYRGRDGDVRYVAVSPDGRSVATGSHQGDGAQVWDVDTGRKLADLPVGSTTVAFSPGGRWLLTGAREFRLWDGETWAAGPALGGVDRSTLACGVFSDDGRTVVVQGGDSHLRIHDPASGRLLAGLWDPTGDGGGQPQLSRDGRWLLMTASTATRVIAWDLAAIDRELTAAGLPWELEIGPAPDPGPLRVTVIGLDRDAEKRERLAAADRRVAQATEANEPPAEQAAAYAARGRTRAALGQFGEAGGDFDRAVELAPTAAHYAGRAMCRNRSADTVGAVADLRAALKSQPGESEARYCNNLAWLLATGPAGVRDPAEAVILASRATYLEPTNMTFVNTLGISQYRAGRLQEAVNTLRRSLRGGTDPAHDLYFLAMCYRDLGAPEAAQDAYDQAEYWVNHHRDTLSSAVRAELEVFRTEAAPGGRK